MSAVERALSVSGVALPPPPGAPAGEKPKPVWYRLGYGGKDPLRPHPGESSYGNRTWTCDCSGFVAWCLGTPRHNKDFPHWGGSISTDSIVEASDSKTGWFSRPETPNPGDLVVYPGRYLLGVRVGVGHVGLIVAVDPGFVSLGSTPQSLRVVHCSMGHQKSKGFAIALDDASPWRKRGRVVRYLR